MRNAQYVMSNAQCADLYIQTESKIPIPHGSRGRFSAIWRVSPHALVGGHPLLDAVVAQQIGRNLAGLLFRTVGIYNMAYTYRGVSMTISTTNSKPREAKLFRNNRSQAVRIPAEFEMPGDRVLIRREGARLIIEPVAKPRDIVALLDQWRKSEPLAPQDRFPDISDAPPVPEEVL